MKFEQIAMLVCEYEARPDIPRELLMLLVGMAAEIDALRKELTERMRGDATLH